MSLAGELHSLDLVAVLNCSSGAVWLAFLAAICIPIGSYTSGLAVQYGVKDVLVASGDMRYKGPYLPVVTNYSSHDCECNDHVCPTVFVADIL